MSRDLYGELLANVLNRGAPQGHFAAYIQPNEAAMLRSQGGGVAPGGGQYMANGLPSFQPIGSDQPGIAPGTAAEAAASGWGPGGGSGGVDAAALAAAVDLVQAIAPAVQRATPRPGPFSYLNPESPAPPAVGTPAPQATAPAVQAANAARRSIESLYDPAAEQTTPDRSRNQRDNLAALVSNPAYYDLVNDVFTDEGRTQIAEPITRGGLGRYSPGAAIARNNANVSAGIVAQVNQENPATGGYAINDPTSNISVPRGYNMGWVPSIAASAIGMMNPLAAGINFAAGVPTAGRRGMDALSEDQGMLGTAIRGFRGARDTVREEIGNVLSPITDFAGQAREEVGDLAGRAIQGIEDFLPGGGPQVDPGWAELESRADPGPDIAPIDEFVTAPADSEEDEPEEEEVEEEEYYVPPGPVQDRIADNLAFGRGRVGLA